jgi:hypothetical protein
MIHLTRRGTVFGLILALILLSTPIFSAGEPELKMELPNPGITPDSFWYFGEVVKERIMLIFTFNKITKVKKYISLVEERTSEAKLMLERGQSQEAVVALAEQVSLLKRCQYTMKLISEQDLTEISFELREKTQKQSQYLKQIAQLTEDQLVKPKITEARSWLGKIKGSLTP